MKHFVFPFVLFVLFLTCVDTAGQERAETPVFGDGDFWQYRVDERGEYMKTARELNGIYELVHSNGRLKVYKLERNQKQELNFDNSLLVGLIGQTDLQHLQFPLYKGRLWNTDYNFRPRRRDVERAVTAATKVTDFGDVTIRLGTFKAFELHRETRFGRVDHWAFVYYWSPQTKSVVKYEMSVLKGDAAGNKREIELIKFGSAR
jgi:hypothetical protein